MILNSKQLTGIFRMSRDGLHNMIHNLRVPYIRHQNRFLFDTSNTQFPDFFQSIELAIANPKLKPIYSIRDLARLRCQSKNTVKKLLLRCRITTYRSGRKLLVLLVDFYRFSSAIAQQIADNEIIP